MGQITGQPTTPAGGGPTPAFTCSPMNGCLPMNAILGRNVVGHYNVLTLKISDA